MIIPNEKKIRSSLTSWMHFLKNIPVMDSKKCSTVCDIRDTFRIIRKYTEFTKRSDLIWWENDEEDWLQERQSLEIPICYNEIWSMDFMCDALFNSRRFRTLNIIDDYNRESIWIEIGLSIGAMHITDFVGMDYKKKEENPKRYERTIYWVYQFCFHELVL